MTPKRAPFSIALCPLHAAAPELLNAAEDTLEALNEYQTEDADCLTVERVAFLADKLRDAVARATGKAG